MSRKEKKIALNSKATLTVDMLFCDELKESGVEHNVITSTWDVDLLIHRGFCQRLSSKQLFVNISLESIQD